MPENLETDRQEIQMGNRLTLSSKLMSVCIEERGYQNIPIEDIPECIFMNENNKNEIDPARNYGRRITGPWKFGMTKCFRSELHIGFTDQSEGVISIEPLSIKLNRSVSDLRVAGHLPLFKAQDHPLNEEHFCGYFMEVFERFFSSGIHECIFIMDNVRFNKTNRVQTIMQENGRKEKIVKPASPRSETDLFNQVAQ
ncbi:hypothetical protein RF11_07292 [Thelohanellus kitauei]|uniref:Tc1-like transposase DDE domain-containing protein n=1 Tax=Thelohanellus kitauei TaxID=669202 RepID=A0A0C2N013_THEKT|nr:hypothetical protein RF11_07292 [Thelohanellus kitauei]